MICATIGHVSEPVGQLHEPFQSARARLTETAVLKSAGLESLLKSKNSIGDRNPFKRVSCTRNGHRNTKSSVQLSFRDTILRCSVQLVGNAGALRCIRIRIARARGVLSGGKTKYHREEGETYPERFEKICDAHRGLHGIKLFGSVWLGRMRGLRKYQSRWGTIRLERLSNAEVGR